MIVSSGVGLLGAGAGFVAPRRTGRTGVTVGRGVAAGCGDAGGAGAAVAGALSCFAGAFARWRTTRSAGTATTPETPWSGADAGAATPGSAAPASPDERDTRPRPNAAANSTSTAAAPIANRGMPSPSGRRAACTVRSVPAGVRLGSGR